jgi:hypothetical protein
VPSLTGPTKEIKMTNAVRATLAVAFIGSALFAAAAALGSGTAPAGGTVHIFYTQQSINANPAVVFTGAIGDYGKAVSIDKNGTPDPNGSYEKVTLQSGTVEIDATALDTKFNKTKPTAYPATCSGQETGTSSITLLGGTGLYAGVSGTIHVDFTGAFIIPRFTSGTQNGQCNGSASEPTGLSNLITGSGKVSFS